MKFTKGKFASVAAAAVLAGTMGFMPATAFATTVSSTDSGANTPITKTWQVPSDAQYSDDETFTFKLTYQSATPAGTITPTDLTGTTKEVTLKGTDFTKGTDGTTYTASSKTLADALNGIDFTAPGIYLFKLEEVKGSNPNIQYDSTTYTVKVNVKWALNGDNTPSNSTAIDSVVVAKADGTKTTNVSFNNTDPNGNVTVTKTVAGTAANTNDSFGFTLTVTDAAGNALTDDYQTEGVTATKSGNTYTFSLKSGEKFELKNLPEGAKYTVVETDNKNYDSTDITAENTDTTTKTATGTIANNDNDQVKYVNNKGFAPATGITMNTLPFVAVGVVAVAGGAALVISRRRHAGEDF